MPTFDLGSIFAAVVVTVLIVTVVTDMIKSKRLHAYALDGRLPSRRAASVRDTSDGCALIGTWSFGTAQLPSGVAVSRLRADRP